MHTRVLLPILFLSADTMTGGIWVELASLNNPELQQLAASLPATLLDSQSDNTEGKYGQAFKRWKV